MSRLGTKSAAKRQGERDKAHVAALQLLFREDEDFRQLLNFLKDRLDSGEPEDLLQALQRVEMVTGDLEKVETIDSLFSELTPRHKQAVLDRLKELDPALFLKAEVLVEPEYSPEIYEEEPEEPFVSPPVFFPLPDDI